MMMQLPQLRVTWLDGSGSTAECRFTINGMLSVATIEGAATGLVAALSAMTDAVFMQQEIVYTAVPSSGAFGTITGDVLRNGVFIFQDDGSEDIGLVEVPGIKDDLLETSGWGAGVLIIQSDSRVLDFVSVLHDNNCSNPFAVALGELAMAYRQSRA